MSRSWNRSSHSGLSWTAARVDSTTAARTASSGSASAGAAAIAPTRRSIVVSKAYQMTPGFEPKYRKKVVRLIPATVTFS
ncbi:hypothetical protein [Streptomyces sp. NPDC102462]|uniref:hypothetical protein n=1 Tax=Streptomyces sp. NPDC102462 TaxID=3366178 RepID=UPI0038225BCC